MSKEKVNTQSVKRKLTRKEKKQIAAAIRQAKGDGKPYTAQDSIPFEIMYMLADFMEAENGIVVNLHIRSIEHNEAIKTIKRKITDLDRMKIEEQKKAVHSGYDMDIIPSDLATYGGEAKNLLRDLQSRNERMFLLTLIVLNLADTKRKLENDIFGAASVAQKYNCALTRLDYQQEQGLMSSIPLGENLIKIQRGLTTSSTAIFVPFTVQELFQRGEALYYGLNALSNNMILCDRKLLKNPNGLILGILLFYFLEMSDYEIAKRLNMVRRSVTYRRTSTLKLLKELIGGNTDEKQ